VGKQRDFQDLGNAMVMDDKAETRRLAAKRRDDAHATHALAAAQAACAQVTHLLAQRFAGRLDKVVLAGFRPIRSEVDPSAAMIAHPGPLCVPVVEQANRPLVFHRWTAQTPMVPGRFGVAVPATPDPIVPDVVLVPLLAFDPRGYRLGYGGGFYDRTLQQLRADGDVLAIGFAYAAQQHASVPIEPTDERLDLIVTERDVLAFTPP